MYKQAHQQTERQACRHEHICVKTHGDACCSRHRRRGRRAPPNTHICTCMSVSPSRRLAFFFFFFQVCNVVCESNFLCI